MIKPNRRWLAKQALVLVMFSLWLLVAVLVGMEITESRVSDPAQVSSWMWTAFTVGVLVLWLVVAPLIVLWFFRLSYEIENDRVTARKGLFSQVEQTLPFRTITDVRLQRSVLDRILRIGAVDIQTAGQSPTTSGYDARLTGLTQWEAVFSSLSHALATYRPEEEWTQPVDPQERLLEEMVAIRTLLERQQTLLLQREAGLLEREAGASPAEETRLEHRNREAG